MMLPLAAVSRQAPSKKADNFKRAVESGKSLCERDARLRELRYAKVDKGLSASGLTEPNIEKAWSKFAEREREGLRAKCKQWSTDDFEAHCVLGKGSFGTVYLVKRSGTEEFYALKQMKKSHFGRKNIRDRAYAERNILAEKQSMWFVSLHATFQDAEHIFMVMEFVQGGDLFAYLDKKGTFTAEETKFYMAELLEALDAVHHLNFVHRDVKPDNIVLTAKGHLKLLDFGLAKSADARDEQAPATKANATLAPQDPPPPASRSRARLKSKVGTPFYMAPEVYAGDYGPAADIWSLGIVTFECMVGYVPFHCGEETDPAVVVATAREKVSCFEDIFPRLLERAKAKGRLDDTSQKFLSNVISRQDTRLNAQQCRSDSFFSGIDFARLHLMQPPIVPEIGHAADTSCFETSDFESIKARLPPSPASVGGVLSKKDVSLEWSGYEFDRTAQELQSPDVDVASLVV